MEFLDWSISLFVCILLSINIFFRLNNRQTKGISLVTDNQKIILHIIIEEDK